MKKMIKLPVMTEPGGTPEEKMLNIFELAHIESKYFEEVKKEICILNFFTEKKEKSVLYTHLTIDELMPILNGTDVN